MRVAIAGITNFRDAELAIEYGADALGFLIGLRHKSEDAITANLANKIISDLPPFVTTVMITHLLESEAILRFFRKIKTSAIQLHDDIPVEEIIKLKRVLPGVHFIKAVHINGLEALRRAQSYERFADALILDTINPLEDRIGGTGLVHDWRISAEIRKAISKPVILAGGLNPENVKKAIETVSPYAVDVNTGVKKDRNDRRKDPEKIKEFIMRAKEEFWRLAENMEKSRKTGIVA